MSYGQTLLPPPTAGWYTQLGVRAYAATDDGFGLSLAGTFGGIVVSSVGIGLLASGHVIAGIAVSLAVGLLLMFTLVLVANAVLRGFKVPRFELGATTPGDFYAIRDPSLRSVAEPLWRSYLASAQAYSISDSIEHKSAAKERARRLHDLATKQSELDSALALSQGGGFAGTDDLDRADALLAALHELASSPTWADRP